MRTPPTALALRQARQRLLEHGDCPSEGIDARVARSWRRSLAAGLLPGGRLMDTEHAHAAELKRLMASQHELLVHSRPVMDVLFSQVQSSQSMVILADARGTLMHTLGRADFLQRAQQVALSCGASWHEQHRGTNAIGTALAEGCEIDIHGGEHFLERNEFLTCTAAPIVSATGKLLGVLDISGDHRAGHPHTQGLVSMAARLIENRLISASAAPYIRLHLHPQREGIGTVAEGLLLLSGDGWVVGGNRAGLGWLGLTAADIGSAQLHTLLDVPLNTLLAQHHRRPTEPVRVQRPHGEVLFLLLQPNPGTLPVRGGLLPQTPAQSSPAPLRAGDALAQLDTGDLRWRSAADKARRVADKPIPLLIQGESGVGKELFARAVHDSGPRRAQPFVAINCAAVPENLIEAELFGYAPGAFTGARREGSPGRVREAQGGTLFLDEIGDMPLTMQARLLRVLQERQVSPLGGGPSVAVDFALICATHCKLREAAEQGRFRSDLYYRINGLTVQLPPLRERTDFAVLTQSLLRDLNPGRPVGIAPELLERLRQHPWPGNLRQYANVLRTASAMLDIQSVAIESSASASNLQQLAREAMRQAIDSSRGNMSQAARQLGISRQTLYRKLNA
ncbi:MAG: sigma-54 dependent transcription regulator [Comamonadaceae bacterium]|nr:MAG: sigma-54 dependent transcription regulator [Comamonadaceae bacterium]